MSTDARGSTGTNGVEVPVTHTCARSMGIVAEEASDLADRGVLTEKHRKVMEVAGRTIAKELTAKSTVGIFAVREGDDPVTTASFDPSALRAYLETLDAVATGSPNRLRENACQRVFDHLTENVDVDALGIDQSSFETLQMKQGVVFGSD
jgi:hypothetical protein